MYFHDNDEIQCGVLDGSILSAVADSGATASVGTLTAPIGRTGKQSNKRFRLPNGAIQDASKIGELPHNVREPAKGIHIIPGIADKSLISTLHFAKSGYVTIFDKDQVNIYNKNDTIITISREAVIRGWRKPGTNNLY